MGVGAGVEVEVDVGVGTDGVSVVEKVLERRLDTSEDVLESVLEVLDDMKSDELDEEGAALDDVELMVVSLNVEAAMGDDATVDEGA
mgnify:CR=1 FL=1